MYKEISPQSWIAIFQRSHYFCCNRQFLWFVDFQSTILQKLLSPWQQGSSIQSCTKRKSNQLQNLRDFQDGGCFLQEVNFSAIFRSKRKAAIPCITMQFVRRMSLFQSSGFIGGKWKDCVAKFPVYNPATGEEIGRVSDMGRSDADEAVNKAYEAFRSWKNTTANVSGMIFSSAFNRPRKHWTTERDFVHFLQASVSSDVRVTGNPHPAPSTPTTSTPTTQPHPLNLTPGRCGAYVRICI